MCGLRNAKKERMENVEDQSRPTVEEGAEIDKTIVILTSVPLCQNREVVVEIGHLQPVLSSSALKNQHIVLEKK
jgi:hypothetical protein